MTENTRQSLIFPPAQLSPIPFWFWNDKFDNEEIIRQINDMHSKEVDGFVIHPRMGVPESIEYMSDEFLGYVECAVKEAARLNMHVVLYDEAMYPSGSAHGKVVGCNPQFASKGIKVIESDKSTIELNAGEVLVCSLKAKKIKENMLDYESIEELSDGKLHPDYIALHFVQDFTNGHIRGIHIGEDDWENPPKSSDLLNHEAVDCFIELTHEKYYSKLSKYFGNTIIGIFTDEPSIMGRDGKKGMKPWTDNFLESFLNEGLNKADLAALWYDVGKRTQEIQRKYDEIVRNRLAETFYKKIFTWCEEHGIALVGHPGKSQDIGLLKYFHIPGQDLIFRRVAPENNMGVCTSETTQAKCSADSARHRWRNRNLNECFACSGKGGNEWAFTFDDMKWMTDWLIVRGVNMIVPHAFFYSMNGERRFGERPPDMGPNNIWWKYYAQYSRYVKRLCYLMTDSVNTARTAVLCQSCRLPHEIVRPMYENQIEFNYLEEELLQECSVTENKTIQIARQEYEAIVIDDVFYLSDKIIDFANKGIKVVVYNPQGISLPENIISISAMEDVVKHLKKTIEVSSCEKHLRVSCVKKGEEYFYLLVNEGEERIKTEITIPCDDDFEIFYPWTGEFSDKTFIELERRESIIVCAGKNIDKKIVFSTSNENYRACEEIELYDWSVNGEKIHYGSWTENEKTKDFFGIMKYETDFTITLDNHERVILDLGDVREQAEAEVNGQNIGARLWAPFTFDITSYLMNGKNILNVYVANSIANKYTDGKQPSGLLSPVKIRIIKT